MKKIIAICVLLSFVILLSGCSKTNTNSTTGSGDCNTDAAATTCALPVK